MYNISFSPPNNPMKLVLLVLVLFFHFTDEEMESQRLSNHTPRSRDEIQM